MRHDGPYVNQASPSPSLDETQPSPLAIIGRGAIAILTQFYEQVVIDYERINRARIEEIDYERRRSQRFLDWLGEILKLVGGKRGDENVVDAVARFVEAGKQNRSRAIGSTVALRESFRRLCEKHNIVEPCMKFSEGVDGCAVCGHPSIVHAETAS